MRKMKTKGKGQSITEFAIMLPVLLTLMFGLIELGRLLVTYSMVITSSREAIRYGVTVGENASGIPHYLDCDGMKAAGLRIGRYGGLTADEIDVKYDLGNIGGPLYTCADVSAFPEVLDGYGHRLVITVSKTWSSIIPFLNLGDVPISAASSRTIIKDLQVLD